ncbi:uncharacterized protein STEHIDRAFT_164582 [Stereum hirsutum FP-91666 SS1]|uniref:uncharacterized protein n=1 Tax=Stereum hirsutum (strain FP-91666) TaxID=721885 RepID=UPI000440EA8A|nr:uncharacterized protein STEHIDRAFT_164582 [Stereum hirsutum FP-91666 SS1]EIM92261.1 hypothetical protein STEHIDRAFT_164582 [Stereum hirsutum FP-91666 SS1]
MAAREEDAALDDLEGGDHVPLNPSGYANGEYGESASAPSSKPGRSIYALTRQEITRGIANRFVHSRIYILLYLAMAALSITTVVLSLKDGCPTLAFYILEVIINTAMIAEVVVRFLALGSVRITLNILHGLLHRTLTDVLLRACWTLMNNCMELGASTLLWYWVVLEPEQQFWKYPFNIFDLIVTTFCVLTLLVIVFNGCGTASKEEEILDTLLLVARNILQFGRLATVVRQSGQSIFTRPKPIDLTAARRAGYSLDMDLDLPDDDESDELRAPLNRNPVLFDSDSPGEEQRPSHLSEMPRAVQAVKDRDEEDVWAEIG